jgi:hypothetical protein
MQENTICDVDCQAAEVIGVRGLIDLIIPAIQFMWIQGTISADNSIRHHIHNKVPVGTSRKPTGPTFV